MDRRYRCYVASVSFGCMIPEIKQKSSSKVAAPLMSVQTGRVGVRVANVSPQSTASVLLMKQCSFIFDDFIDSSSVVRPQ